MTQKNFESMSTKKLNALLATASVEDQQAIQAVLDSRKPAAEYEDEEALTPEQEAALAEAEENGGINPMYAGRPEKAPKMSAEELQEYVSQCKENIGHKCSVVPFNTDKWVEGYIAGVTVEKRAGRVLYAIKTNEGKRIVKVADSHLLKISEELAEVEQKVRGRKARPTLSEEEIETLMGEASKHVGKCVDVTVNTLADGSEEPLEEVKPGRIMGVMLDRRVSTAMYKITLFDEANTQIYKVVTSPAIAIAPEFDEEGAAINAKHAARRKTQPMTLAEKVKRAEENLQRALDKVTKAQAEVEMRKQLLEALMNKVNSTETVEATEDEATEELA